MVEKAVAGCSGRNAWYRASVALLFLSLSPILGACGSDSDGGPVGPPPGPVAPVFAYVDAMVGDPWFTESLPGDLADRTAAAPIQALLRQQLPHASASRDLRRLSATIEILRGTIESYRSRSAFDPVDSPILSAFDLFVEQAIAIRDGNVRWSPGPPLLQRQEG